MSHIIAGRFDNTLDADHALGALQRAGFRSGEYESFYVSPPGQHGSLPFGGDSHSDAGSRGLGALLSACIGAFAGSMAKLRDGRRSESTVEHPVQGAGGRMIAINVDRAEMEARAVQVLRRHGAREVGRTEGEWRNGSWRDFDPRSPLSAA